MAETEPDFAELGVAGPIVASLAAAGITHPFPIQALTLPVALSGADIIGQAKTGTGKTLGFGIPCSSASSARPRLLGDLRPESTRTAWSMPEASAAGPRRRSHP